MSLLVPGDVIADRYEIVEEIGRGGMQEVYEAHDQLFRRSVALKVPQDATSSRRFRDSAVISARINHPSIAKTLDYVEDGTGRFFLVEELVVGLNLRQLARRFVRLDPHTVIHVLHHLAKGVGASHAAGVVHRDLKPSNILVAGGLDMQSIKITDFGIAKMAAEEIGNAVEGGEETTKSSKTLMNALSYIAPEVIEKPREPSKPADVWAIAAIAWELLTGTPPFGTGLQAVKEILGGSRPELPVAVVSHRQFGGLTKAIGTLIGPCFEYDANKRPSASELVAQCEGVCYMPPSRETGVVSRYRASTHGIIDSAAGESVFFHTRNVIGGRPRIGTEVWFTKFDGSPAPRAIPVVPMLPPE